MKPAFGRPSPAVHLHGAPVLSPQKRQEKIPETLSFPLLCSVVAWAALTSTACSLSGSPPFGMLMSPPAKTITYSDYKKSHSRTFSTAKEFPIRCAAFFHNTASGHLTKETVDVSYHEPTFNENRTALRDLQNTTIYLRRGKGPLERITIPSTRPVGGGHLTLERIPVPLAHDGKPVRVQVCVTASDYISNESQPVGTQVGTITS